MNAQVVNSSYTGRILPQKSNQHMTLFEDGGAVYYYHDHNDRLHTKELEFTNLDSSLTCGLMSKTLKSKTISIIL